MLALSIALTSTRPAAATCVCEDELGNCFPRETADGIEPHGYCGPPGWRARQQADYEASHPPEHVREYLKRELKKENDAFRRTHPKEARRLDRNRESSQGVDQAMRDADAAAARVARRGGTWVEVQAEYERVFNREIAALNERMRKTETREERAKRELDEEFERQQKERYRSQPNEPRR